jgi:hypothetical protein
MKDVLGKITSVLSKAVFLLIIVLPIHSAVPEPGDTVDIVRAFTRDIEFDYLSWTLDALGGKLAMGSFGPIDHLPTEAQTQAVIDYLILVQQIEIAENHLADIYGDPELSDAEAAAGPLLSELDRLYAERERLFPLAEAVLQHQVSMVVAELGLAFGGQSFPPVLYQVTPLPKALIISPRDVIRQDADISLRAEISLDEAVVLEEQVENNLDYSALVTDVGGVGLYPTMVMQTRSLNWLAEVVAHEWIHNYLTLRPLGVNYFSSPQLRTMNETTASLAGKEIGAVVIERYYPEFAPPPPEPVDEEPEEDELVVEPEPEPPTFDFRAEMRETRLTADELLAEGKIEEAEVYMEERRQIFWDNGYRIRKLNQAYFAFHGAYADVPGGAAGDDPVGDAVRRLRASNEPLADFVNQISWMWSVEQLYDTVAELSP